MKCENPLVAVSLHEFGGKKKLKFFNNQGYTLTWLKHCYGEDNVFQLPCGRCEACRVNYAQEWSVRLALESLYHKFGYFITLTYDDFHLKKASHKDWKRFYDNLKHLDKNLVFFACEEFGDLSDRFHFHAIILTDLDFRLYDPVKKNNFTHYHSSIIDHYWTYGIHDACEFDFFCGAYVAKYTSKPGSKVFMSKNIGRSYFDDHWQDIVRDNFKIYEKFGNKSCIDLPRYFIRLFVEKGLVDLTDYKHKKSVLCNDILQHKKVSNGFVQDEQSYFNDISKQKSKKKGVIRNELD